MGVVITIIIVIGLLVIVSKMSKKKEEVMEKFEKEMKESVYCNGLTVKEKESSNKFRKGLLFFNEIAITRNSAMNDPEELERKLISLATEFPEIIYGHACDRLKKYNSISSRDREGLMRSLRDIIGEDMEQNIMNARNERQIDGYFEELIDSTVRMIKKL